jgi:hypothetical protein
MALINYTVPSYSLVYDRKLLRTTLRQAGAEIARIDRALLKRAGTGRKHGNHRASAPGMPSSAASGVLARSIKVKVSRSGESVRVIESLFYALFLEAGARGGGRQRKGGGSSRTKRGAVQTKRVLAPRPSLSIAFKQVEGTLQSRIIAALNGSIAFKPGKIKAVKP